MHQLVQQFANAQCKVSVPDIRPGYQVKISQRIKEGNKERVQVFEGMVIRKGSGHGVNETITVRKISEGIGVEKTFPLHAPSIEKIEVLRAVKVRRSKLFYVRGLSGKSLRFKEIPLVLKEKLFGKPEEDTDASSAAVEASQEETAQTVETTNDTPEETKEEEEVVAEAGKTEEGKEEETKKES